ncbi:hypothetical protein BTO05_03710 [Winogradskyella sp. PC-19]|uniref:succinylglutamate desuccinylase/aspartoacylase family protein n=1 Tax=unclassified Winogradskyella TaxID=2615021 RepID=UPI000B3C1CCD|nr:MULTISPECIES: M14 family metallopeptidase [unclassified Winogradskyella]ARV08786.1 hypothetical protein BTO05_03710 [Winogradskyella sp. PC-19]RZN76908.1 MAG: succinylglutamate desuccinylase [Winogradskyella sp.]
MKLFRFGILFLLLFSCKIIAQSTFTFKNTTVKRGTKSHFLIPITHKTDTVNIPVTVFHGLKPGPTLGITAGVHGYEYPPILAAQELNKKINPIQLKGTIILVQVANVPAFLGRSPYLNPLDDKNLNRSFPGKAKGSLTERIAHFITTEVISKSDYFVDIHAGDAPEDLRAYNAWYQSDALPKVSQKGRDMALAMGFDYSIIFKIPEERLKSASIYCSQEAFHRKIPSVDIECGKLGLTDDNSVTRIVDAMVLLFNHLDMIETSLINPKSDTTIISKRYSIKSKSTGIFYSSKRAGQMVNKGETLGYITDFFGNKLEDVQAQNDGIILYMIGTPPINKDETIFSIGLLQ